MIHVCSNLLNWCSKDFELCRYVLNYLAIVPSLPVFHRADVSVLYLPIVYAVWYVVFWSILHAFCIFYVHAFCTFYILHILLMRYTFHFLVDFWLVSQEFIYTVPSVSRGG